MSVMKEIKKQIDSQTRPNIGQVKVEAQSSIFSEEGGSNWDIGRTGEPPIVMWNKTSYSMDRGADFILTPEAFNAPASQISNQMVPTITGNFRETNTIPLYNCRYSGWAGITGGGTVSLSIRTGNSSVSVWIDGEIIFSRAIDLFTEVIVNFNVGDTSLIQIFWYSYVENNSIAIVGDLSHQISSWATSDSTPFFRPVEWYAEDPITSDAMWQFSLDNFIKLKWWFNLVEEVEENEMGDFTYEAIADLGGFGVWSIDFQEVGEMDVIDGDTIAISGYFPSVTYLRIPSIFGGDYNDEGRVLEVEYIDSYNSESNISYLIVTAHGLLDSDDSRIIEIGTMRNVAEIAFSTLGGSITDIFETVERGLIRGERYYYLIDTFDSSPSKNRGGITEAYETIIAGDYTAPTPVTNLTGTRVSTDSVEIAWDDIDRYEIERFNIYSDANSPDYATTYIESDFFALTDSSALEAAWISSSGQVLISIEMDVDGSKYVRKISDAPGGSTFTLETSVPHTSGNAVVRFVSLVGTHINSPVPPRPILPPIEITQ